MGQFPRKCKLRGPSRVTSGYPAGTLYISPGPNCENPATSILLRVSGPVRSFPLPSNLRAVVFRSFMMVSASLRAAVLFLRVRGGLVVRRKRTRLRLQSSRAPAASCPVSSSRNSKRIWMPGPIMRQYAPEVRSPVSHVLLLTWMERSMERSVPMPQVPLVPV